MKEYVVWFTDHETGATSPIDNITESDNYTADDYINDCMSNAAPEYCEIFSQGTVYLEEIEVLEVIEE